MRSLSSTSCNPSCSSGHRWVVRRGIIAATRSALTANNGAHTSTNAILPRYSPMREQRPSASAYTRDRNAGNEMASCRQASGAWGARTTTTTAART
uniref:Uncharacterized protein n=1 Tax=Oryza nivara TaxID=4536 RepID=A0A0E0FKS5_ORYNI